MTQNVFFIICLFTRFTPRIVTWESIPPYSYNSGQYSNKPNKHEPHPILTYLNSPRPNHRHPVFPAANPARTKSHAVDRLGFWKMHALA